VISDLKRQQAKISLWGVGTNLATAYDHPALDGVYKLCALRDKKNKWEYKLKLSEQEVKISNPGRHQIRRFFCNNQYMMDVIYDLDIGISDLAEAVLLDRSLQHKHLDDYDGFVDLLKPIIRHGKLLQTLESIHDIRKNAMSATQHFIKTQADKAYSVGLETRLFELKQKLVKEFKT
jgi:nicotinate phosphoribosyltransferase